MPSWYTCSDCGQRKPVGHKVKPDQVHTCWDCRRAKNGEKVPFAWRVERRCACGCGTPFMPTHHLHTYEPQWHGKSPRSWTTKQWRREYYQRKKAERLNMETPPLDDERGRSS